MMNSDAKDFLIFVQGYHQLFCGSSDLVKYQSGRPQVTHDISVPQDDIANGSDLDKVGVEFEMPPTILWTYG